MLRKSGTLIAAVFFAMLPTAAVQAAPLVSGGGASLTNAFEATSASAPEASVASGSSIAFINALSAPNVVRDAGPVVIVYEVQNIAVPEPATWAMMMLGFGAIGAGIRRRRTLALRSAA